jgi:hypothetical protein
MPQGLIFIFDRSTIQSLTVDKAVLLDTEKSLTPKCIDCTLLSVQLLEGQS